MPLDVLYGRRKEVDFLLLYLSLENIRFHAPYSAVKQNLPHDWRVPFSSLFQKTAGLKLFSPPWGCRLQTQADLRDSLGVLMYLYLFRLKALECNWIPEEEGNFWDC